MGPGRRWPDPALHRPPPRRTRTACGSASRRSACSRRRTAARRGRRATRAFGRASSPDIYPEFGQCVHKLVMAADGGEHLYQQNHCGVYRSANGGEQWEEITTGLPSEFGFPMTASPARPAYRLDDPAEWVRPGPVHAGCVGGRVAHARRRRHLAPLGRRTAATGRLPAGAARGDGQRRHGSRSASTSGRARASCTAAQTRAAAGRCWPTTCRRSGRSRPPSLADGAPSDATTGGSTADATDTHGAAPAIVHLPRSLVALFPGTERRVEADGATVAEVIADLDRRIPGIGSRRPGRRPEPPLPPQRLRGRRPRRAADAGPGRRRRPHHPGGVRGLTRVTTTRGGTAPRRRCCRRTAAASHGPAAGGSPGSRPCGTSSDR